MLFDYWRIYFYFVGASSVLGFSAGTIGAGAGTAFYFSGTYVYSISFLSSGFPVEAWAALAFNAYYFFHSSAAYFFFNSFSFLRYFASWTSCSGVNAGFSSEVLIQLKNGM